MSETIQFPRCFVKKQQKRHISITVVTKESYRTLSSSLDDAQKALCRDQGFDGSAKQIAVFSDDKGASRILLGIGQSPSLDHGAKICRYILSHFAQSALKDVTFSFDEQDMPEDYLVKLSIGWGLATIRTERHNKDHYPQLVLSQSLDQSHILGQVEGAYIVRSLVNKPANELGPDELVTIAGVIASSTGGKMDTIRDKALLKENFPMIYAVGNSSHRRPALIDLRWEKKNAPKVTLVGKGVVFDTGGLDLKPPRFMRYMKKDMGGAAQTLGLAWALMKSKTPISLRVLIPAVENAVSSDAFRPGDVINTRKGITVEVSDTDAEGRLVLSDALTYACEENPEMLIDFATLTGAARVALGSRIGALFGHDDKTVNALQNLSFDVEDPLWRLPLWEGYDDELSSEFADTDNIGSGRAGAIHGGLFLKKFVEDDPNWLHLDVYAWEDSGRDLCDKGGLDTGMRAVYALLKDRYA